MKSKKNMLLLLFGLLLTNFMFGCSKNIANNKEIILKWIYPGEGIQEDTQMVWDAFNEKLKDYLPNTKLEFEIITFSDYAEKWKLKSAAREEIDIAWTGYTNTYVDEIANGSFMELDNLLELYGKDLKEELPDWVWEKAEFNGKIYSIPNYQMMNVIRLALYTPKELSDQFLTPELEKKIINTTCSHKLTVKEDYDVIAEYLQILKENQKLLEGVDPLSISNLGYLKGYEQLMSQNMPFAIAKDDPEYKVLNVYEQNSIKATFEAMREWFEKGYIRKDIASDTSNKDDAVSLRASAYYELTNEPAPGKREIHIIPLDDHYYISSSQSNTSTVIPTTSRNPEKAMILLNLMNTAKGAELLNLLTYGMENDHYIKITENIVDTSLSSKDNKTRYSAYCWALGNIFNAYEPATNAPGWNDYIKNNINKNAVISPVMGFKPDLSSIKTEISQVLAVKSEFDKALKQGTIANWQEKYDEMIEKMKIAGSDKIIEEVQNQLDLWRKSNKN